MQRLFEGDPGELRRLLDVWRRPNPSRTRSVTSTTWCGGTGESGPVLRFIGQLAVCDIWNELNWQEWVPADGETWACMASLYRHPGRRP